MGKGNLFTTTKWTIALGGGGYYGGVRKAVHVDPAMVTTVPPSSTRSSNVIIEK